MFAEGRYPALLLSPEQQRHQTRDVLVRKVAMSEVTHQLRKILESLDAASQFCTSGSLVPVLPGLEVQGVGEVALPIGPSQARQLMQQAVPAPYGRGEETIVDATV